MNPIEALSYLENTLGSVTLVRSQGANVGLTLQDRQLIQQALQAVYEALKKDAEQPAD